MKPTKEQFDKLPKYAQAYITHLERRRAEAERDLKDAMEGTKGPFYTSIGGTGGTVLQGVGDSISVRQDRKVIQDMRGVCMLHMSKYGLEITAPSLKVAPYVSNRVMIEWDEKGF